MKNILHIIPYKNLFPPQNGGQLRCFHLMDQLARFNQVDVLSYQSMDELAAKGYTNSNINFYTPKSFANKLGIWLMLPVSISNTFRYRCLRRSLKGPAGATVLDFAHIIKALAKIKSYDLVVYEHIASLQLAPLVKRQLPSAKTVIDAHNIDYKLIDDAELKAKTKHTEEHFYQEVDTFWACSQEDVEELEVMNQHCIKGTVVPNGVDTLNKPYHTNKEGLAKKLLFCGSLNYHPNKEGLLWFYNKVWPIITKEIEDIELCIIGRGDTKPFKHFSGDKRIKLVGEVEDVLPYYQQNYIAIVPLLSGSGTRLKILEAMSFGNPIVTTSIGIEGINVENRREALIADTPEAFSDAIIEIINTPELGETFRDKANQLIKSTYDWNVIGEQLNKNLSND